MSVDGASLDHESTAIDVEDDPEGFDRSPSEPTCIHRSLGRVGAPEDVSVAVKGCCCCEATEADASCESDADKVPFFLATLLALAPSP